MRHDRPHSHGKHMDASYCLQHVEALKTSLQEQQQQHRMVFLHHFGFSCATGFTTVHQVLQVKMKVFEAYIEQDSSQRQVIKDLV